MNGEQDLQARQTGVRRQDMIEAAKIIQDTHIEAAALADGMLGRRFICACQDRQQHGDQRHALQ